MPRLKAAKAGATHDELETEFGGSAIRARAAGSPRALVMTFGLGILAFLSPGYLFAQQAMDPSLDRGSALAEAVYDRPDGDTAVVFAKMTLRRKRGKDRVREFYSYRMDFPDGEVRALTRFTLPGNVAGVGLLVHSKPASADDQWLFLPALQRIRRISSENRGGRFVQSGLYYEDLRDRKPDKDRHQILGEGDYEGTPVTLLESTPIDPASSVYSRRISWIHEPTMLPLRIEYFQGGEDPIKYLEVKRLEKIEGFWTATESVITHPKDTEETILTNLSTRYDIELPASLFDTSSLQNPQAEAQLRP